MSLDIPELDFEDHHLNELVTELNEVIADGGDREEIAHLMMKLMGGAVSHFEHEERIMAERVYPSVRGHAALHLQIRAELEHAMEVLRNAESRQLWADYGLLVQQLFVEHIRQEAMQFRNFSRTGFLPD